VVLAELKEEGKHSTTVAGRPSERLGAAGVSSASEEMRPRLRAVVATSITITECGTFDDTLLHIIP